MFRTRRILSCRAIGKKWKGQHSGSAVLPFLQQLMKGYARKKVSAAERILFKGRSEREIFTHFSDVALSLKNPFLGNL